MRGATPINELSFGLTYSLTRLLVLLVSLNLIACSTFAAKENTGAIEHQFMSIDDDAVTFRKFFYPCDEEQECDLSNGVLEEGDSVSIKLLTVFVCDFAENNTFPANIALWIGDVVSEEQPSKPCQPSGISRSKHYTQGEIVVLANAFELGGNNRIAFSEGNSDLDSARVVYYDDDVRESGQFLNMVNMPIYGPITYGGAPLYLRLIMMELDNEENSQFSSMLSSLADYGKQAYPPSSFALSILNGVGSALLSGDQDDLEFRYDMVFDAPGGEAEIYLPLKVGIYVFVRSEDRSTDITWPDIDSWDYEQARILDEDDDYLRTNTYFVISVTRNERALAQDTYQTFSELADTTDSSSLEFENLASAATEAQQRFVNLALYDDARFRANELAEEDTSEINKAQHREILKQIVCDSLPRNPQNTQEDTTARLTPKQLRRVLAIAGPILESDLAEGDSIDAGKATIAHWVDACP